MTPAKNLDATLQEIREAMQHGRSLSLFLDLNETLIRTGEVGLEDRLAEQRSLEGIRACCEELIRRQGTLSLFFVTGNSFEYSRRVEEPLGLKNLEGLDLYIASENGLLGRGFHCGDLWIHEPTKPYREACRAFLSSLGSVPELDGTWYSQGNEIRVTLKPVADAFTPHQLDRLRELAGSAGLLDHVLLHEHRYYLDLDPRQVLEAGRTIAFPGKEAVRRLLARVPETLPLGFGDSASDIPLFRALSAEGGACFWVANTESGAAAGFDGAIRCRSSFSAAVLETLQDLLDSSSP